jgi:hypothetical protein
MEGEEAVAGPPPDASPFLMEDVLHRLHLLRYEETYLVPRDLAPFHKFQFSSAGAGNQFPAFVGLVTYLLTEARRKFAVDRFDDPTTVLTKLVAELRAMGAPADVMDFQPLKLRTGCGEAPCRILLFCADAALAARGFKWARPVYPEEVCVRTFVLRLAQRFILPLRFNPLLPHPYPSPPPHAPQGLCRGGGGRR